MIVSKPNFNTLFALMAFCIGMFAIMGYTISVFGDDPAWYQYLIAIVTGTFGVIVLLKTLFSHKKISVQKNKIEVSYTLLPSKKTYYFKSLASWTETKIKTPNGDFSELTILFEPNKKVKLSKQENTSYDKIFAFLKKSFPKKHLK